MEPHSTRLLTENFVGNAVQWLKLGVETLGALIIALGIVKAGGQFLTGLFSRPPGNFVAIRLTLARYLALALEFQLGADILSTAIAPSWDSIGRLGAIAVIRTALNFFLSLEMRQERAASDEEPVVRKADGATPSLPHALES